MFWSHSSCEGFVSPLKFIASGVKSRVETGWKSHEVNQCRFRLHVDLGDLERRLQKFQHTHRVHLQINSRFYPRARAKRRSQMRSAGWYLDFRLLFHPLFEQEI